MQRPCVERAEPKRPVDDMASSGEGDGPRVDAIKNRITVHKVADARGCGSAPSILRGSCGCRGIVRRLQRADLGRRKWARQDNEAVCLKRSSGIEGEFVEWDRHV